MRTCTQAFAHPLERPVMPRILYYALGGGLGHLVRAGRFLRTQGLAENALVLSASEHALDARLNGGVAVRCVPRELQHDIAALRVWLSEVIESFAPDVFCVDCFPAGILGELAALPALHGIKRWHVARLLRWNDAANVITNAPRYDIAWRLEALHAPHEAWLQEHCDVVRETHIAIPTAPPQSLPDGKPFWLVAHSEPAHEVAELVGYALEQRRIENADVAILVASFDPPCSLPDHCIPINAAPLAGWYETAQRIFGAAGFNFIHETGNHHEKRVLLPFPRRFDDQFARANRTATLRPRAG